MYFTAKHVVWYEVQAGSLSMNNTYEAIALRDETIVTSSDNGYVNYFAREGARVAVGDLVYTVDESGKLADYIGTNSTGENSLSQSDLTALKSEIVGFANRFDRKNFNSVYDFKYDIEGSVMKLVNISMYENIEVMNQSSLGGMVSLCAAGKSGYIVYNTDGYETLTPENITAEIFDQTKYEKIVLITMIW